MHKKGHCFVNHKKKLYFCTSYCMHNTQHINQTTEEERI